MSKLAFNDIALIYPLMNNQLLAHQNWNMQGFFYYVMEHLVLGTGRWLMEA